MSFLRKIGVAALPLTVTMFALHDCYGPTNDQSIAADINNDCLDDKIHLVNSNPFLRGIYQSLQIDPIRYNNDIDKNRPLFWTSMPQFVGFQEPVLIQDSAIFDLEAITSIEARDVDKDGNSDIIYNIERPRRPGGDTKFILSGNGDGTFMPRKGMIKECSKPGMVWDKYGCE